MVKMQIPYTVQYELEHDADDSIFRSVYTFGDDGYITFFKDPNTLSINYTPPYSGLHPSAIWLVITLLLIPLVLHYLQLPEHVQNIVFMATTIVMLMLAYIHSLQLALSSCRRSKAIAKYKYVRHLLISLYDTHELMTKIDESNAMMGAINEAVGELRKTL